MVCATPGEGSLYHPVFKYRQNLAVGRKGQVGVGLLQEKGEGMWGATPGEGFHPCPIFK